MYVDENGVPFFGIGSVLVAVSRRTLVDDVAVRDASVLPVPEFDDLVFVRPDAITVQCDGKHFD